MGGLSLDNPLPGHLVVLENVQIHELLYDERQMPYFVLAAGKIRVYHASPWVQWIEEHLDTPLDVTIFPYQWAIGNRSGVINYFRQAEVHIEGR